MTAAQALETAQLDEILQVYRGQKGAVIPVLQKAQKIYGYLPAEILQHIARRTQYVLLPLRTRKVPALLQ